MSGFSYAHLSGSIALPDLAAHFCAGVLLGWLYYRSLWTNISRLTLGGGMAAMVSTMIGRFALLGCVLALVSLEGALPLLVLALGIFAARPLTMHLVRETAS